MDSNENAAEYKAVDAAEYKAVDAAEYQAADSSLALAFSRS